MTDIAKIAEGLTAAEYNGLWRTLPGANYAYREMHGIPRVSLFRKGLLRKHLPCAEYRYELTDEGAVVRAHLERER